MASAPQTEPTAGDAADAAAWRERLVELMAVHQHDRAVGVPAAAAIPQPGGRAARERRQHAGLLYDLYGEIFREAASVEMAGPLEPPASPPPVEPDRYVGRYERSALNTEVYVGDDGLTLRATATGPLAELMPEPVHEFALVPVGPDRFVLRAPGETTWSAVTFYALDDASRYVHYAARANPLVDAVSPARGARRPSRRPRA